MSLAIAVLITLFAISTGYSLHVIELQKRDDTLVRLAGRLQFAEQHLAVQAMRYKDNAPRDYQSYYRDLELYFEDLKKTRATLDMVIGAFAGDPLDNTPADRTMPVMPSLPPRSREVAVELATRWQTFQARLDEQIGPDKKEPRLEWAATWITEGHPSLADASARLLRTLEEEVQQRAARANLFNRIILTTALLVSIGIALWFYFRVLKPLSVAVQGFNRVANGDFRHRVEVEAGNEIGLLSRSFNRLIDRLEALKNLLTGLQHGADLDETLKVLSSTLPKLIPVDWIGVLVLGTDGRMHLERAYSDGQLETLGKPSFELDSTLLEECIFNREPLHIPDVRQTSSVSEHYVFLRQLYELGRLDAVFLPLGNGSAVEGVAVFANRFPNSFRVEHLEWLRNLGVLLGVSLARTLQLIENSRLATIGQFASGIVHEIRNPLATIGLALDHFSTLGELPAGAKKRVGLATDEVDRLERLLNEILQYAKPLVLNREPIVLADLLRETLAPESIGEPGVIIDATECAEVSADRDRLRQVLINLVRNAQQAAPPGTPIVARCQPAPSNQVELSIRNEGEPIAPKALERVFEPFFTSKSTGTGLGLPIVQRIVRAHGGEITLLSDELNGTRAIIRLPAAKKVSVG